MDGGQESLRGRGDCRRQAERCTVAAFEDGGRGHRPRNVDKADFTAFRIQKGQGNGFSPEPPEGRLSESVVSKLRPE